MGVQSIIIIVSASVSVLFGLGVYFTIKSRTKWRLLAKDALATIDVLRREKQKANHHMDALRKRINKVERIAEKIQKGTASSDELNDLRSGRVLP